MKPQDKWNRIQSSKLIDELKPTYDNLAIAIKGYPDFPKDVADQVNDFYDIVEEMNPSAIKKNYEANMEEPPLPLDYGFGSSEFNQSSRKKKSTKKSKRTGAPKPRVKKKGKKATKKAVATAKPAKAKATKATKAKATKTVKTVKAKATKKATSCVKKMPTRNVSINKKVLSSGDIIKVVGGKTGLPQAAVKAVLQNTLSTVTASVKAGKKVTMIGFGTFEKRSRKSHRGTNPRTKKAITIAASETLGFKPSENQKKAMKSKAYMENLQEKNQIGREWLAEQKRRLPKSKK